ncbi:hypothetical protein NL676_005831 [Syzygium grande]|nr:hypothetical protein NL676_005831 [Syzygium grande]
MITAAVCASLPCHARAAPRAPIFFTVRPVAVRVTLLLPLLLACADDDAELPISAAHEAIDYCSQPDPPASFAVLPR